MTSSLCTKFMNDTKTPLLLSQPVSRTEIQSLLQANGDLQRRLFEQAREVRRASGNDHCLLRGVIEVSNYCQKNCSYCAMRASNRSISRYRMSVDEILNVVDTICDLGITVVFLQSGQDLMMDDVIAEVIPKIKKRYGSKILLCIGERKPEVYQRFYSLGADSYILKFETSDPGLYKHIAHGSLKKRLECIDQIHKIGYQLGVGNIIGLPNQTLDTISEDILLSQAIQPEFVSSAPFIPNPGTPFEDQPYGDVNMTLNWMAISRILLKNCLIPAVSALEKIQKGGQLMGLNAGANVMTINFTPRHYREQYSIYSKQRFIVRMDHALKTAESAGLPVILDK